MFALPTLLVVVAAAVLVPLPQNVTPPEPGTPQSPKVRVYSGELMIVSTTASRPFRCATVVIVCRPPPSGCRPRMCRYMVPTESWLLAGKKRCMCSGDCAIWRTISRTVVPLFSLSTQPWLPASAVRSSMCRYNSSTTWRASVVHGCCAMARLGAIASNPTKTIPRNIDLLLWTFPSQYLCRVHAAVVAAAARHPDSIDSCCGVGSGQNVAYVRGGCMAERWRGDGGPRLARFTIAN